MSADFFTLVFYISGFFTALFLVAFFLAVLSAFIIYYLPDTRIAKWLESKWFDPIERNDTTYENIKVGDCITPRGDKNGTN
jgi:hypothetical protein